MPGFINITRGGFIGLALLLPCGALAASAVAESIVERDPIDDDYYGAGGEIVVDTEVVGDVVVVGGEIYIGHQVAGDVIAAGGSLKIRGAVDDDVRISGGDIDIDARIGDDLAASGGSIGLSTATTVGGNAWLAGGEIRMAGTVTGNLKIIGGDIRLSGTVHGDVDLEGGEIQILDGARIHGNLNYQSPRPAATGPAAEIVGMIDYETEGSKYADHGFGLFFSITLVVASILFYLLFPRYTVASVRRIGSDPFNSLGLGFVFVVVTPIIAFIMMLLVLGLWVGMAVLALYWVALLCGFLIACFYVGDRGARLFRQNLSSLARRLISVIVAIFVLGLVQTIPLIGGLILFLLLLFGLGAGLIQLRYVYQSPDAVS